MKKPVTSPPEWSKLILGLTYACQSRCVHCSCALHPVSRKKELSVREIHALIRDAVRAGVKGVNLFGGEPTLRRDFPEILDLAATYIGEVTVDTNGYLLTQELAALMRSRGVRTLFVSLAGASGPAHDRIQRVASFERVKRAISTAVRSRVPTHVSVCAFKEHVKNGELERIVDLARSLGAQAVRIALPMCSGRWLETAGALLDPGETARVRALAKDPFVYLVEEESGGFVRCHAVSGGSFYVSPYGDVQPCNFIPMSFGNIRKTPLEIILDEMTDHRMFRGEFLEGSCPMHRPEFAGYLAKNLDTDSRLAPAPPPESHRIGASCNNRCRDCRMGTPGAGVAAHARTLKGLPGEYRRVLFLGGEPTLDPQIVAQVSEAAANGREVVLHTNARVFAYPGQAIRFRRAGLSAARVPYFADRAEDFDAWTRAPGSAEQALRGIGNLARSGVRVEVLLRSKGAGPGQDGTLKSLMAAGAHRVVSVPADGPPACGRPASPRSDTSIPRGSEVLFSKLWREPPDLAAYDVILIYPHNESVDERLQLPYALLFLAAPLVAAGLSVKIIDQRVSPDWREELGAALRRSPHLVCVGISCFISRQVARAVEVARFVRKSVPGVSLVWGGAFPSLMPDLVLGSGLCDFVVRGEGERSFHDLCDALRNRDREPAAVPGVVTLKKGSTVETPAAPPVSMNELPPLPYRLVSIPRYDACRGGIQWALYTSRGCPYACRFCAISLINQRRWRAMGARRVIAEIETALKLGAREIAFCEDNFFVDLRRVRAIAEEILRRRIPLVWSASCRVDAILRMPSPLLKLLFKSGLRHLHVGAESGSDRILSLLDKRIRRTDIEAANIRCKTHGIVPEFIFMTGFPGESGAERAETLSLIDQLKKANPEAWFWRLNHYVPYPGTPLYAEALAHGFKPPRGLSGWADLGWHRSELSDLINYQVGF